MTDRVNALYNRSYKAFIKKDNKGKDKEMELNNDQLDQIKKVMDEELEDEEDDKKRSAVTDDESESESEEEEEEDKKRKAVDVREEEIKEICEIKYVPQHDVLSEIRAMDGRLIKRFEKGKLVKDDSKEDLGDNDENVEKRYIFDIVPTQFEVKTATSGNDSTPKIDPK